MRSLKFIPFTLGACLWLAACGLRPAPAEVINPTEAPSTIATATPAVPLTNTPVVNITNTPTANVTNTPVATPTPTAILNPSPTPTQQMHVELTPTPTSTPTPPAIVVVPTNVQYVLALVDLNLRSGPGTTYPVIGSLFGGQIAPVSGITADGGWWRVICPSGVVADCFAIANPTLTQPTAAPGGYPTPTPISETGAAVVESIEVQLLESSQVRAIVHGYLPDACTTIAHVNLERQEMSFRIQITTTRRPDARCAQQLTPFAQVVPLEMNGLPAGQYQVSSNNVFTTFTWVGNGPVNNVPQRIEFQPGKTSETIASRVLADTQPKLYVLWAQAGQTMLVRLT